MKISLTALFFLAIIFKLSAQAPVEGMDCNFYKNLKFKKGVDTVILKAIFKDEAEMMKGGSDPIFETLTREKKINTKEFQDQIGFTPAGCSRIYYGPSKVDKPKLLTPALIGKPIYVKCIFFERKEWEFKGVPFFVIIDVNKAE